MKIAVFDIGTNSIHMLIVEIRSDLSYEVLGREKDPARLGDGSFETKRLTAAAMNRALEVIGRFHKIAKKGGVRRFVATATSAVREAKNGGEFVAKVFEKTGMTVNVISGDEEGRLVYLAARSSIETQGKKALVIDIGGGSVELIVADGKKNYLLESYKLGVTRLTEKFIKSDPPTRKELRRLDEHVRKELKKCVKRIREIGFSMVIGTSGTMMNLASVIYQEKEKKPLKFVNHYDFSKKDLERVHKKLVKVRQPARARTPGLDPKRADIILAGSTLVLALFDMLNAERVTISYRNIREGMILNYIEKNQKGLTCENESFSIRERSVLQLARRCSYEEPHAWQVARLSQTLFDVLKPLHGLGAAEREILRYASLLHDIGSYMSYKRHHKHSQYLIVNSDLDGFTPEEVDLIGVVARHHRKRIEGDEDFQVNGSRKPSYTAKALAAILRVADGLDRTHFAVVRSLGCKIGPKKVRLTVQPKPRQDTELEIWAATERADLFEKVFRKKLEIVPAPKAG